MVEQNLNNQEEPIKLERRLGLWSGVAVIVGVIVGSGIFISPKGVFEASGSAGTSLLVWAACGLLSLIGALCMAELGTSIPASGGDYYYIKLAYGPCLSFLFLWTVALIILPCSNALAALTFAHYVLQPFYTDCTPPAIAIQLIALTLVLLLVWVNCASVDLSIKLQNSFTSAKVLALAIIIAVGLHRLAIGKTENIANLWEGKPVTASSSILALYSGLYSYAGWNSLNFVVEEIKNPVKNIPRAIVISLISITLLYVLVNVSYFVVLDKDQFLSSSAIAVTFGKQAMGPLSILMPFLVALSTTSGLNALIFSSSRILMVGAREGQLLSLLSMININKRTPVPSLLFVGFMSSFYLFNPNIDSLTMFLVFIEALFAAITVSTVLVLRRKFPETTRPLMVHSYIPILYLLASIVLISVPIVQKPLESTIGLMIMLSGIPVHYITSEKIKKPDCYEKLLYKTNVFTQKLTMSVISVDVKE